MLRPSKTIELEERGRQNALPSVCFPVFILEQQTGHSQSAMLMLYKSMLSIVTLMRGLREDAGDL